MLACPCEKLTKSYSGQDVYYVLLHNDCGDRAWCDVWRFQNTIKSARLRCSNNGCLDRRWVQRVGQELRNLDMLPMFGAYSCGSQTARSICTTTMDQIGQHSVMTAFVEKAVGVRNMWRFDILATVWAKAYFKDWCTGRLVERKENEILRNFLFMDRGYPTSPQHERGDRSTELFLSSSLAHDNILRSQFR